MRVPNVGSYVKIRVRYSMGPAMIPPQPDFQVYQGKVLPPLKWLNDRQFCMEGTKEYPIRIITLDSILDIKLLDGSYSDVDTGFKTYEVDGSKGAKYIVTSDSKGWNCTCPGFQFRRQCKHVSTLSRQ